MHVVPGSATRDDVVALRDVLERARYPGTAPFVSAQAIARVEAIASDVERSIRADVLIKHTEPAEHAASFVPGELDPADGG
jgi:hypothetical protein